MENPKQISPEDLGGLLFNIHHHIEHDEKNSSIIYYEKDILDLLTALGLPQPIWGKNLNIKEYIASHNK